ncbi:hypothetical protein CEXT_72981 [Caerostris extrusa]|uniref:Uncharacterized protein n=1 Tax=Caerostris extrusa TaxID=172846 RepID=A0AAV4NW02_CAEEX|nr:hypothetical protein CEXT_72981 [Caerostris extrusa]
MSKCIYREKTVSFQGFIAATIFQVFTFKISEDHFGLLDVTTVCSVESWQSSWGSIFPCVQSIVYTCTPNETYLLSLGHSRMWSSCRRIYPDNQPASHVP